MIVKQQPEDFIVEELTDVRPQANGPFAFYRLEKTGWTTPDAFAALRRRWRIDHDRLSYGGLKDRHARTTQYFTIRHGPAKKFSDQKLAVHHLGQLHEPYSSRDIRANRFRIVVRGIDPDRAPAVMAALEQVRRDGMPNYFDDQRFGSVRPGDPFLARALIAGDFENALRVALTAPYDFDRAEQKREKALLRKSWGDWTTLARDLPQGHARSLVHFLVHHPTDFRGAIVRLRPELRGLYLSAYQSHLWNRVLARFVIAKFSADRMISVKLRLDDVPVPISLAESEISELTALQVPLPSARTKLAEEDLLRPLIEAVLAEEGIALPDMKVPGVREVFFSKGERTAHIMPSHLRGELGDDESRSGRKKLTLGFDLPRGSYATLILKRLGADAIDAEE